MKTQNLIKKTTALLMCASLASQLAFAGTPLSATPEKLLLEKVIAVSGEGLPADQVQRQTIALISAYEKSAPQSGQLDRLQQAMVDIGLYSQGQAQDFVQNLRDTLEPALTANYSSQEQQDQALVAAFSQIKSPQGAEFSSCGVVYLATFYAAGIGGAVMAYYAYTDGSKLPGWIDDSLMAAGVFAVGWMMSMSMAGGLCE